MVHTNNNGKPRRFYPKPTKQKHESSCGNQPSTTQHQTSHKSNKTTRKRPHQPNLHKCKVCKKSQDRNAPLLACTTKKNVNKPYIFTASNNGKHVQEKKVMTHTTAYHASKYKPNNKKKLHKGKGNMYETQHPPHLRTT